MRFLKRLYQGWLKIAHAIGRFNTKVILTLFYFTALAPVKIISFILRKDLLDERLSNQPSYWKKRKDFKVSQEAFLKPY